MIVTPVKTRIFQEGENLFDFLIEHLKKIREDSIIVITSKIVSLAEKRTAVIRSARTKDEIIKNESQWAIKTKFVWLTIKDGMIMPSAGVDESNAKGKLILLPKDSYKTADLIRKKLIRHFKVKRLGILITDSRTMPLRAGVNGVSLGYAGFKGLRDYRGKRDIFGRKFHYSRLNMADTLASAAIAVMGEGAERQPLAIIEGAPLQFTNNINRQELRIDMRDDMYKPLFKKLPSK